jgi:hypothetical protein
MEKVVRAKGIRGRRGDIILELENGKIALPRGFTPREWEWYFVEIIEDRGKYAFVQLHSHHPTSYGICRACRRIVDEKKFAEFANRWLNNMLLIGRLDAIKKDMNFVLERLDEQIKDLDEMIRRLYKELEKRPKTVMKICEHSIDSCFTEICGDKKCVEIEYAIIALEKLRDQLNEKWWSIKRALDADRIITITPLGIERIFVPSI